MTLSSEAEARNWFATALGCNETTIGKLDQLVELLREENARQNLVSAASLESVWLRHLADSAQLLVVPRETPCGPWLDLGSGAGFPGLLVALCRPDIEVILVEKRTKRIAWLEEATAELGIANAHVAGARLQSIETFPAMTISARAFAPLPHLLALSARFSTRDTQWLLPKGRNGLQELLRMPKTLQSMFHVEQSITDGESVILIGRGVPQVRVEQHR